MLSKLCAQCRAAEYDADTPLYTQTPTFSQFESKEEEKIVSKEVAKCIQRVKREAAAKKRHKHTAGAGERSAPTTVMVARGALQHLQQPAEEDMIAPLVGEEDPSSPEEICAPQLVEAHHVFGSGAVESVRGFETVKFGGAGVDAPLMGKFPFWQIKRHEIAAWDAGAKFSAIVGLGPRDHVPPMAAVSGDGSEKSQQDTMLERSDVNNFSICLQRGGKQEAEGGHVMTAEGMEENGPSSASATSSTLPSGHLTFNAETPGSESQVEVVGKVHWAATMFEFGARSFEKEARSLSFNICKDGCAAVVDSGTSLCCNKVKRLSW